MTIDANIFKAYDIRGLVDDNLGEEQMFIIGRALATRYPDINTAAVGYDGRLSSPALSRALISGLNQSGISVINIGEVPTPALYFAAHQYAQGSGFMITGSHNPPAYNGIKMTVRHHTLAGDDIQDLYQLCMAGDFRDTTQSDCQTRNILDDYLDCIAADVNLARPLNVAVDCGNGVAGPAVRGLLERLATQCTYLYCDVDGNFPNHHPNPSVPENLSTLIHTVKEKQLDIGLAFDGDGDRLGVVDNKGCIIWADKQMMIFARDILHHNPGSKIIYDVKSSRHLRTIITDNGGIPQMCRTGHSFIKAMLAETGALLAGEMSGHLFFNDRWYGFDDAVYAAARLLEILSNTQESSHTLFANLPNAVTTPEINIHFKQEPQQHEFMQRFATTASFDGAEINTLDGVRAEFDYGWGLVRASNTTPSLVIRFEADSETEIKQLQSLFREQLLATDSSLEIPF